MSLWAVHRIGGKESLSALDKMAAGADGLVKEEWEAIGALSSL
jgi:hypothetical protein